MFSFISQSGWDCGRHFLFFSFYFLILLSLIHFTMYLLTVIILTFMWNPRTKLSWGTRESPSRGLSSNGCGQRFCDCCLLWSQCLLLCPRASVMWCCASVPFFAFYLLPGGHPLLMEFLRFSVPSNMPSTRIPRPTGPQGSQEQRCPNASLGKCGETAAKPSTSPSLEKQH